MRSPPYPETQSCFKPKSPPSSHRHRRWLYAAALFTFTAHAFANTDNWTGGTDNWSNPADWSNNLLPADGDDVTITPSDGSSRTITYD
jgi:hypothetical protein